MPVPSNLTPETAIALTVSGTVTQEVYDSGTTYDVWYKYANDTAVDQVISLWVTGTLGGGGYTPWWWIWADVDETLFINEGFDHGSATLPIPAGVTYYIKVRHDAGNFNPSTLTIGLLIDAGAAGEAGQVFIPSASIDSWMIDSGLTGNPGGFIDAALATIVGFVPQFPTGEGGDVFPTTGRVLMVDEAGSVNGFPSASEYYAYIYSPQFAQLSATAITSEQLPPLVRMHLPTDTAYLVQKNAAGALKWQTLDADGVESAATTITGASGSPQSIAANNAATILYMGNGSPSSALQRWDLVNHVFLSNLAAAVANYRITDLLVLADDSIVACYYKTSLARDCYVVRYSAAGAVLNTYTFTFDHPLSSTNPRLGYSATADAFWLFAHLTPVAGGGYSDIRKVQTDGTELAASLTPDVYFSEVADATPPVPYTSDSCPILELRFATDEDDEEEAADCPALFTPVGCWSPGVTPLGCAGDTPAAVGCWSPGITPLGCGSGARVATGCWSGFSQDDLAIGRCPID